MPIKLTGLVFLAVYLHSHPIVFSPLWALAYFVIGFIGAQLYVWVVKRIAQLRQEPHYLDEEADYLVDHVTRTKKENPLCFWLAPAESAFFYVPLLYVGVNPFTAAVAAVLFGLMHYPEQLLRNCVFKIIVQCVLIWLVLPHGILTMMAGHFLLDYLPLAMLKWTHKGSEKTQEQKT